MIDISVPLGLLEARLHPIGNGVGGVIEVCCPAGRSVLALEDAKKLAAQLIKQIARAERITGR